MAISKNQIKYIHSLQLKKNRNADNVFLAEGPKLVGELLGHLPCRLLVATAEWLSTHPAPPTDDMAIVSEEELARASLQKTPQQVLAVFQQPHNEWDASCLSRSLCLALDGVQDPGNLGTIIRLADWFGIEHIFCSMDTADAYNPKVVQATMGSILRVNLHYTSIPDLIRRLDGAPIYGTFLEGDNIYSSPLSSNGLIIMGNEGNGISREVENLVTHKLHIPSFPANRPTSESLNVAVATAIVCAEFRRQAAMP